MELIGWLHSTRRRSHKTCCNYLDRQINKIKKRIPINYRGRERKKKRRKDVLTLMVTADRIRVAAIEIK